MKRIVASVVLAVVLLSASGADAAQPLRGLWKKVAGGLKPVACRGCR